MARPKLVLIHWNEGEANSHVARLRRAGWDADCRYTSITAAVSAVTKKIGGVIIYLDRMPTKGREVARRLKAGEDSGSIPLIFVDGEENDRDRAREIDEGATFTTHDDLIDVAGEVAGD